MVFIVLMQCGIAIGAGIYGTFYQFMSGTNFIEVFTNTKEVYQLSKFWFFFADNFGRWFVLILNIVPISMLVTLEGVKFFQAVYI
jgi:hypothetical protein